MVARRGFGKKGYERKKKVCVECGQLNYIWSKGRCQYCANKEYAATAQENRRKKWTSEDVEKLQKEGKVATITNKQKKAVKEQPDGFAKILAAATKSKKTPFNFVGDRLDEEVQRFIRLRAADENGYCKCASCGVMIKWQGTGKMHCGHWISRSHYATRWDLRNLFPQCAKCNDPQRGNGMPYELGKEVERIYGEEVAKELKRKSKQDKKGPDLVARIELLIWIRQQTKILSKEKGLKLS